MGYSILIGWDFNKHGLGMCRDSVEPQMCPETTTELVSKNKQQEQNLIPIQ